MLSYEQILLLHEAALREHGGNPGILNESNIHSAIGQPHQTFDGVDLYMGPVAKAAALGYFLTKAHGFGDGNKRVGYMAMKVALFASGFHLVCDPDDGEFIILAVAEGEADLDELTTWVQNHIESAQSDAVQEIAMAMKAFLRALLTQNELYETHTKRVEAHLKEKETLAKSPKFFIPKRIGKINRALASDINNLSNGLRAETVVLRACVEVFDKNAPNFARWVDMQEPVSDDELFDILVSFGTLLDSSTSTIDRVEEFCEKIELMRDYSPETNAPFEELLITMEDIRAIFNESWFGYKDVVDGLKAKMKEKEDA